MDTKFNTLNIILGIFKYTVAYRPIAKQWLRKQRPLLGNARNMQATIERRVYSNRF
jgi:hypothetical protein